MADELHEAGCVLCGATTPDCNGGILSERATGPHTGVQYCASHRDSLGDADLLDAEITRRKALRSQPAPTDAFKVGEPQVGETWHSDTYDRSWGQLRVERFYPDGLIRCRGTAGTFIGDTGGFHRQDLIRRLPAPPATEAITAALGSSTMAPFKEIDRSAWKELLPKDPYAAHRAAVERHDPAVEETARLRRVHQATVREDTIRDLDRPLTPPRYPSRSYACVGVMGDGVGVRRKVVTSHPSTWPSQEGED